MARTPTAGLGAPSRAPRAPREVTGIWGSTTVTVVTHDLAFGRAAVQTSGQFVGIIYLRPGPATFVLGLIDGLRQSAVDVSSPFVFVAERRDDAVCVRVRTAPPW